MGNDSIRQNESGLGDGVGRRLHRRRVLKAAAVGVGATTVPAVSGLGSAESGETPLHTLTIAANGPVEYTFTVDGRLTPDTDGGDFSSDSDEAVRSPMFEDTATMNDQTGPILENATATHFLGDRYFVDGIVEVWGLETNGHDVNVYIDESRAAYTDGPDNELKVDGEFPTRPDFRPNRSVTITANGPITYELWAATAEVEPDTDGGNFSSDCDDATTTRDDGTVTVTDETGPVPEDAGGNHFLGDRFLFSGSVEELDLRYDSSRHDVFVYLDEQDVAPDVVRRNEF